MTDLRFCDDPALVLQEAADFLAAQPVITTVVAASTTRFVEQDAAGLPRDPGAPRWWCLVRDAGGSVTGIVMRTAPGAPYPLYAVGVAEENAAPLARLVRERPGEPPVTGVNGFDPGTTAVARELARPRGLAVVTEMRTRLFEARAVIDPPPPSGGRRPAGATDVPLVAEWFDRFHAEAAAQAGRPEGPDSAAFALSEAQVAHRVAARAIWLWEDDGHVVSMTGCNGPSFGVCRIGPVYTPQRWRRRGYAGATVAAVTRAELELGHRVCLFTDQANPTSNGLYRSIGFEPVSDNVNLALQ